MSMPLVVVGAGGHAKVVIDTLREMEAEVLGLVDRDAGKVDSLIMGVAVFDEEGFLADHQPGALRLCSGIAFVAPRRSAFKRLKGRGYEFAEVIHPSAVLAGGVIMGEGSQVMAGAVVQPDARIGDNALVNTRASIDHDCVIGNHVHVAPGAVLAGSVHVGEGVHIGAGATVLENLRLGDNCVIGAGAVVIEDVAENSTVVGVPARVLSS
jgi:UDP-perosamine 4-acetyltransferase